MNNENEKVFLILEKEKIDLASRMYLAKLQKEMNLKLSDKFLNQPITDFSFFQKYQYLYWWISEGEYLAASSLQQNKSILAIRKHAGLDGLHEIRYYKPSKLDENN